MKFFLLSFILSCLMLPHKGEASVSRKIIIENSKYYYVNVDDESQIHFLNFGSVDQPMSHNTVVELPWAASGDLPINQLMWDFMSGHFYCINTIQHSLNDKRSNIKKVPINELLLFKSQSKDRHDYVFKGIEQFYFIENIPHAHVIQKYTYLDTYFSDIMVDGHGDLHYLTHISDDISYYIQNVKKDLVYNDSKKIDKQPQLFYIKGQRYLIADKILYKVIQKDNSDILTQIKAISETFDILIIDRDNNTLRTVTQNMIDDAFSMSEILKLVPILPL